jgi:hypothetical protein
MAARCYTSNHSATPSLVESKGAMDREMGSQRIDRQHPLLIVVCGTGRVLDHI